MMQDIKQAVKANTIYIFQIFVILDDSCTSMLTLYKRGQIKNFHIRKERTNTNETFLPLKRPYSLF